MKKLSQTVSAFFAFGLLITSNSCFAIPTLIYGGDIIYDADGTSPAVLSISGALAPGYTDLSVTPDLATSEVKLSADFLSVSSDGNFTTGLFGPSLVSGLLISDSTNTLLTGNVSTLLLTGREGTKSGILDGVINITGGLLAGDFGGVGSLFAINFNLDAEFNLDMFNSDFSGTSNGSISRVPEPTLLALLSIGLFGMTMTRKLYKRG